MDPKAIEIILPPSAAPPLFQSQITASEEKPALKLSHKKNDETSKVNYYKVISRHREFKRMTEQVMDRVRSVMNLSNKHKGMYTEYSYLWMESRVEFMHYFLTYGRQLTQEELDQLEEDDKAVKRQYPTLAQFREQIDYYEGLHEQLKSIEVTKIFHSWFRVDIRAVIQTPSEKVLPKSLQRSHPKSLSQCTVKWAFFAVLIKLSKMHRKSSWGPFLWSFQCLFLVGFW